MNEQNEFERLVADQLADAGVGIPPESAIEDTIARAEGSRRLPEWLALIKESPMRTNNHLAVGSPTVRVVVVMAMTMLLALALAAAGAGAKQMLAADGPIVVAEDGSGDYTTIADAVAAAENGDEILVRPGTYVEAVIIEADITIAGDGPIEKIVIMAPESGPTYDTRFSYMGEAPYAIVLSGTDARLSGLTLRGEPSRLFADGGAPVVENMAFDNVGQEFVGSAVVAAMVINGGSTATVRDSSFESGGSIDVFESSEPVIESNVIATGSGVFGEFGDAAIIRGNDLVGPGDYGISFWQPTNALVEGNTITDKQDGIRGVEGAPTIKDNTITGATSVAITVAGRSGSTLSGNRLADNNIAISWSGGGGLIEQNAVSGGQVGIVIGGGSPIVRDNMVEGVEGRGIVFGRGASPVFSGNTACNNGENLVVADGATPEDDGTNEICEDAPAE